MRIHACCTSFSAIVNQVCGPDDGEGISPVLARRSGSTLLHIQHHRSHPQVRLDGLVDGLRVHLCNVIIFNFIAIDRHKQMYTGELNQMCRLVSVSPGIYKTNFLVS